MLQCDIGFKICFNIKRKNLMFWRYMADRKLIDVKPTRKEILYGFFCTGISLVLLIIFGITIVIFANKYMQNMKGNQNFLENLSITAATTTTVVTPIITTDDDGISTTVIETKGLTKTTTSITNNNILLSQTQTLPSSSIIITKSINPVTIKSISSSSSSSSSPSSGVNLDEKNSILKSRILIRKPYRIGGSGSGGGSGGVGENNGISVTTDKTKDEEENEKDEEELLITTTELLPTDLEYLESVINDNSKIYSKIKIEEITGIEAKLYESSSTNE